MALSKAEEKGRDREEMVGTLALLMVIVIRHQRMSHLLTLLNVTYNGLKTVFSVV